MKRESSESPGPSPSIHKSDNPPPLNIFSPFQRNLYLKNELGTDEKLSEIFHFLQHASNSLESIHLGVCLNVTDEGMKSVASCINHPNLSIKKLKIEYSDRITTKGVKYLFDEIKSNKCIAKLFLRWINIGDEGAKYIADCLSINTTLTALALDECKIEGKGGVYLGESLLKYNTTLRSLSLNQNYFVGDDKIVRIGECLGGNSHLTDLSFRYCKFGRMTEEFLKGLYKNTRLRSLHFSDADFDDTEAKRIVKYIGRNSNLTELNLSSCKIGSDGARYLADALAHNVSLLSLNLNLNPIGNKGAKKIGDMIKSNTSLRVLNLGNSDINAEGWESLCASLVCNSTLLRLDLRAFLSFSIEEMKKKWIENVGRNRYLITFLFGSELEEYHSDSSEEEQVDEESLEEIAKRNTIRNKRLWRERIHWCCILNVLCRVMMLGEWNRSFPPEMICEILWNVAPHDSLSEGEKKRVMNQAFDKSTIGGDKQTFLECIFGKGMNDFF